MVSPYKNTKKSIVGTYIETTCPNGVHGCIMTIHIHMYWLRSSPCEVKILIYCTCIYGISLCLLKLIQSCGIITDIIFQETYLMHTFNEDFYGSKLKVVMLGYIRPMKDFSSLGNVLNNNLLLKTCIISAPSVKQDNCIKGNIRPSFLFAPFIQI